jgi:hypothetical protein
VVVGIVLAVCNGVNGCFDHLDASIAKRIPDQLAYFMHRQ